VKHFDDLAGTSAALNPVFTVGQQMFDVIAYSEQGGSGPHKKEITDMAIKAVRDVFIPDPERILQCYPHQLSGGMKQRICIAMALVTPRELLIADEPGTALDVTIQDQIHRLLRALVDEKKTALIMITHSLGVVRELVDQIYVMYAGNIVEVAMTPELFRSPLHPYTRGLMDCVPRLSGGAFLPVYMAMSPTMYTRPPAAVSARAAPLRKKSAVYRNLCCWKWMRGTASRALNTPMPFTEDEGQEGRIRAEA